MASSRGPFTPVAYVASLLSLTAQAARCRLTALRLLIAARRADDKGTGLDSQIENRRQAGAAVPGYVSNKSANGLCGNHPGSLLGGHQCLSEIPGRLMTEHRSKRLVNLGMGFSARYLEPGQAPAGNKPQWSEFDANLRM